MVNVTHFMRRPHPAAYSIERLYEDVRAHVPDDINVTAYVNQNFSKGFWARLSDTIRAIRYQSEVNHVTGDVHYITYLLDKRRTILTVHDCEMLARSSGVRYFLLWLFWFWLPAKRANHIVVVSAETKTQLMKIIQYDANKVQVIHNPVSLIFKPIPKRFNSDRPRLLQIGTKANKNIERLAEALAGLDITLVIVGKLSKQQVGVLRNNGIDFENLAGLSDQAMLEEYHRCDLLLLVSTYEGFGLPIVEAQSVGRPVVTSNISSMPEIAGDAAYFVDPFDPKSIRDGVSTIMADEELRNQLIELGWKNAKRFKVETIAEKYASLYRMVRAE
ncbi:MAG: glycosyltransferase family 1 protein [Cyanobacteria bacterium J06555_13]